MKQIIYSVIIQHQAEAHENYLFRDKNEAVAKMEEVKNSWRYKGVTIRKYGEDLPDITPQYGSKIGYSYENDGDVGENGLWEYGCVEILECVLVEESRRILKSHI